MADETRPGTATKSFHGEPQYTLKIQTSDTILNPGGKFKMELGITGVGDVNLSKILVSIPQYIVKGGKIKLTTLNYSWVDPKKNTVHPTPEVQDQEPSFYLILPDIWYMLVAEGSNTFSPKPQIFGEASYQLNGTNYAPYTIDFVIANNATAGDRDIFINFIYKYADKWYQDSKTVRLHINHWYETGFWQTFLQWAALLGFTLTFLLLMKELIPYLIKLKTVMLNGAG
jgi:hypothetical protein